MPNKSKNIPKDKFITDFDLHLFANTTFYRIYDKFGAQIHEQDGVMGVHFATWAPNAEKISIIGDFNSWQDGVNEMTKLNEGGVWSCFIPGIDEGTVYKYSIKSKVDGYLRRKTDPYAFYCELRPNNASVVANINKYQWDDKEWMDRKIEEPQHTFKTKPISIYELHLGSWKKDYNNINYANDWGYKTYKQYAYEITDYVKKMGYTHVELLPVMEHPLDISWGYQVTNYYAPTSRYGKPEDLMFFIDHCHQNGIGVILDWVPAHFPTDEHSLAYFDGKQIYAYESWQKGFHKDWGTYIFDYGRNEVQNFLLGSALFWLDKYHADGLRVDAVASMLYLDYSREHGEWEPNIHGGRENLEAINFIKHLNDIVHKYFPGNYMIAEESTAWPGVTHSVHDGGLGFDMKWNMGWMNDILLYFSKEPIHRKYHQSKITFSLWYAFSENFILPVSHDEVVHGKKTLVEKVPGDNWQKFANVRLFLGFMFAHPGKKLNFMTTDIGQYNEWYSEKEMDWGVLDIELNKKLNQYMQDINKLYKKYRAFFEVDFDSRGFQWLDFSDAANSVLAFVRKSDDEKQILMFTFNMTPVERADYTFGVPKPGYYKEIFNSDAETYGGSGKGNMGGKRTSHKQHQQWEYCVKVTLPPLAMNVFLWEEKES
ncbi:MAG: 1,4-alpha-glucan branching protein GlgB [Ignavibacteriae bacterium]|nr:MAG: 1,4-alpha-glucan branching protein GlgB [Ignavibacteriota bacterium]